MDKWAYAASNDSPPHEVRESVKSWEDSRRNFILMALNLGDASGIDITQNELLRAGKSGKCTAPGEDGITV